MASGVHSLIWQCDEGVLEGRIAQAGYRVALLKARAQPSEMTRPRRVRGERARHVRTDLMMMARAVGWAGIAAAAISAGTSSKEEGPHQEGRQREK